MSADCYSAAAAVGEVQKSPPFFHSPSCLNLNECAARVTSIKSLSQCEREASEKAQQHSNRQVIFTSAFVNRAFCVCLARFRALSTYCALSIPHSFPSPPSPQPSPLDLYGIRSSMLPLSFDVLEHFPTFQRSADKGRGDLWAVRWRIGDGRRRKIERCLWWLWILNSVKWSENKGGKEDFNRTWLVVAARTSLHDRISCVHKELFLPISLSLCSSSFPQSKVFPLLKYQILISCAAALLSLSQYCWA